MVLPRLTVLDERYAIGRAIEAPLSIINAYQAWDLKTEDQVDIYEYFPAFLAGRAEGGLLVETEDETREELFRYGREQFLKEGIILAAIDHPNLVREVTCFEANQTAYRVLEHHPGATLASILEKQTGRLPVKTVLSILMPVLEGLQKAHQHGLIHGAVSPRALFLSKARGPMLRGFRTAHIMLAQRTGDRTSLLEDGFAAPEQYAEDGRQGPWTDVYGCAAVSYRLLTGKMLPAAPQRLKKDEVPALLRKAGKIPEALRDLLEQALDLDSVRRPRAAQAFQEAILKAIQQKKREAESSVPVAAPVQDEVSSAPEAEPETPVSEDPVAAFGEEEPVEVEHGEVDYPEAPEPAGASVEDAVEEVQAGPVEVEYAEVDYPEMPEETPVEVFPAAEETDTSFAERIAPEEPVLAEPIRAVPAAEAEAFAGQEEEAFPRDPTMRSGRTAGPGAGKAKFGLPSLERDRGAKRSKRKGLPVLAALAVVVLVAFSGAYVVMQDNGSGLTQFAHFKAQGDSLFAHANYADAKTEYERALAARPDDRYVTDRLDETQQRLAEVSEARYAEFLVLGDSLYVLADSLLAASETLPALSYFAEANKAYYEALRYRPNDPEVLAKGQLTSEGMNQVLHKTMEEPEKSLESEDRPDPNLMRQQLYTNARRQGDELLRSGDYQAAREQFSMALMHLPGDEYAAAKIKEIDAHAKQVDLEAQYQLHLARGVELCERGRCAEARAEFQRALDLKPDSREAREGLARADSLIAAAQHREQQYQYLRGQGDALAAKGSYGEAVVSYQQALTFKPGDAYLLQKIEENRKAARVKEEVLSTPKATEGVYTVVDEAPQLIGGLEALHKKVRFPQAAYDAGISGRVYVQFVVDEQGAVRDPRVIRGIGGGCDEEALRVIREARFAPGKVDGKAVNVLHTLFITFAKTRDDGQQP